MKRIILLGALLIMFITQLYSQISLTGSGLYTQNFNTLAPSGTSSSVPSGWSISESGGGSNNIYTADNGSNTSGDTYSYGSTGNIERAIGGLRLTGFNIIFGAGFINNTGAVITQLPIAYTGEQWRLGESGRGADRLDFQYSTDATSLTNGTWTDVDNLDFIAPVADGTAGALDGNATANRTTVTYTLTGLNISNGSTIWVRWLDYNISGLDDGLALDDFNLNEDELPVELSFFTASVQNNIVHLKWQTKIEVNSYGFEVLRSTQYNNISWIKISFVSGNGNSSSPKDYSFKDMSVNSGKFIYRLKQIDTDGEYKYSWIIEADLGLPKIYSLHQNHPNPFNPSTKINFSVAKAGFVTLKVYDLLGNELSTLVSEEKPVGDYEIEFDGSNLSSGVYLYKIQAEGFTDTKKFILLR